MDPNRPFLALEVSVGGVDYLFGFFIQAKSGECKAEVKVVLPLKRAYWNAFNSVPEKLLGLFIPGGKLNELAP